MDKTRTQDIEQYVSSFIDDNGKRSYYAHENDIDRLQRQSNNAAEMMGRLIDCLLKYNHIAPETAMEIINPYAPASHKLIKTEEGYKVERPGYGQE